MDAVRTFGIVLLVLTESLVGGSGQPAETPPNCSSIAFNLTDYRNAFSQSRNPTVLLGNQTSCTKVSVRIKLDQKSSTIWMCNNESASLPPHDPGLSFDWKIVFRNGRSVSHAQAYFMCSAVEPWMGEWVNWQTRLKRKDRILKSISKSLSLTEYHIWGTMNSTQSDLCFTLKIVGGKIRDEDVQKLLEPTKTSTFEKRTNGTEVCFSRRTQDPTGIGNLLSDILVKRNLSQSLILPTDYTLNYKQATPSSFTDARVTDDSALNSTMETTSVASEPNLDPTGFDKLKIAMIVLLISIVLLVLVAIYFVFSRNYRRIYRPVARSVETHELNRSDAIRIKQTFV